MAPMSAAAADKQRQVPVMRHEHSRDRHRDLRSIVDGADDLVHLGSNPDSNQIARDCCRKVTLPGCIAAGTESADPIQMMDIEARRSIYEHLFRLA
jgi:hypothetical protein